VGGWGVLSFPGSGKAYQDEYGKDLTAKVQARTDKILQGKVICESSYALLQNHCYCYICFLVLVSALSRKGLTESTTADFARVEKDVKILKRAVMNERDKYDVVHAQANAYIQLRDAGKMLAGCSKPHLEEM
jgi:hypothetical protein